MAKVAFEVDRIALVSAIKQAESNGALRNRSVLHETVKDIYNAGHPPRVISAAVVGLRIKEWKLEITTPVGVRGCRVLTEEHKAAMQSARSGANRVSRGDKFARDPELRDGFAKMRTETEPRLHGTIDKLEAGSMRAAVKLKCLDCCAGQAMEVKFCSCNSCPLFAFRPYKSKPGEVQSDDVVIEEEEEEEVLAA